MLTLPVLSKLKLYTAISFSCVGVELEVLSSIHEGAGVTGILFVAGAGAKIPPAGVPFAVAELSTDPESISA